MNDPCPKTQSPPNPHRKLSGRSLLCLLLMAWMPVFVRAQNAKPAAKFDRSVEAATFTSRHVNLHWSAVSDATGYILQIGTAAGLQDYFNSGETSDTSWSVELPNDGVYYARLWTISGSGKNFSDTSFRVVTLITTSPAARGTQPAVPLTHYTSASPIFSPAGKTRPLTGLSASKTITAAANPISNDAPPVDTSTTVTFPSNGSADVDLMTTVSWKAQPLADVYFLYVGSQPGLADVYATGEVTTTSARLPVLRAVAQYYLRIWTRSAGVWAYNDSTFTTGKGLAYLQYPADGATNVPPQAQFQWNPAASISYYYLTIGSAPDLEDIYISRKTKTNSVQPIGLLPAHTYYAHMYTVRNGVWVHTDTTFATEDPAAVLTYPYDGEDGIDSYFPFKWTLMPKASQYILWIGTSLGASDVFSGSNNGNSIQVPQLADDQTYFARIWTLDDAGWHAVDSTFSTGGQRARLLQPLDG